ncbi:Target of EGR1, member 1 (Nuclear), partial [Podochytrium sp. JEL0797]
DLRQRYSALRQVASSCALLSLGVSCFRGQKAQRFDVLLLPMQTYSVEPKSLAFLVDHNFDFNAQAREGVPFMPGNDSQELQLPGTPNQIMRDLFTHILAQKKPLVIHNGLLDLIFIYRAFYAELPETLDSFVADLAEMFPAGIVDTKYVADYVTRESASYLAYLYRK